MIKILFLSLQIHLYSSIFFDLFKSHLSSKWLKILSEIRENFDPHRLFSIFLLNIGFDHSLLIDLLIGNETEFLPYFVLYPFFVSGLQKLRKLKHFDEFVCVCVTFKVYAARKIHEIYHKHNNTHQTPSSNKSTAIKPLNTPLNTENFYQADSTQSDSSNRLNKSITSNTVIKCIKHIKHIKHIKRIKCNVFTSNTWNTSNLSRSSNVNVSSALTVKHLKSIKHIKHVKDIKNIKNIKHIKHIRH